VPDVTIRMSRRPDRRARSGNTDSTIRTKVAKRSSERTAYGRDNVAAPWKRPAPFGLGLRAEGALHTVSEAATADFVESSRQLDKGMLQH